MATVKRKVKRVKKAPKRKVLTPRTVQRIFNTETMKRGGYPVWKVVIDKSGKKHIVGPEG